MSPVTAFFQTFPADVAQLGMAVWIRWAIVLCLLLALGGWYAYRNRAFRHYLRHHGQKNRISQRLLQLTVQRGFEAVCFAALLFSGMVYHDIRTHHMQEDIATMRSELAASRKAGSDSEQRIATLQSRLSAFSEAARAAEERQTTLDNLKPRYENLFINYYVLKRCNLAAPTDFHIMNSALLQELSTLGAPADIRGSILLAARGTADELYAELPCDAPDIALMQHNIRQYIESVLAAIAG